MPNAAHFEWALKPSASRSSQGQQRERVVLGVAAKKQQRCTLPAHLFGQGETQVVAIKFHRGIHVFAEQINGAEADDFKRTRQKNAVNVVVGGKLSTWR